MVLRLAALLPRDRMGIVEADQPFAIRPVQRQRVVQPVRLVRRHRHPRHHEANPWNDLHAKYEVARIDHQQAYSLNGVYSNGAESFFSRLRRAEMGYHHHVSGPYLVRYAQESAWREDKRRVSNGDQVQVAVSLALASRPSSDFCGYWQRHKAAP